MAFVTAVVDGHVHIHPCYDVGAFFDVLVPCLNEAAAIPKVIGDFRRYLPDATIFRQTGLVLRLRTALLVAATAILSFLSFACGLILDTVSRRRAECERLAYLSFPVRFTSVKFIDP